MRNNLYKVHHRQTLTVTHIHHRFPWHENVTPTSTHIAQTLQLGQLLIHLLIFLISKRIAIRNRNFIFNNPLVYTSLQNLAPNRSSNKMQRLSFCSSSLALIVKIPCYHLIMTITYLSYDYKNGWLLQCFHPGRFTQHLHSKKKSTSIFDSSSSQIISPILSLSNLPLSSNSTISKADTSDVRLQSARGHDPYYNFSGDSSSFPSEIKKLMCSSHNVMFPNASFLSVTPLLLAPPHRLTSSRSLPPHTSRTEHTSSTFLSILIPNYRHQHPQSLRFPLLTHIQTFTAPKSVLPSRSLLLVAPIITHTASLSRSSSSNRKK